MAANNKRRKQQAADRRWWRLAVLGLGGLLVLGSIGTWVAAWITEPTRMPLKTVRITGELAHLDRARLQQLVAGAIDGGFFSVDMAKLRDAAEQLAWVDEVSIRRVWPQTLVIEVTEQVPVARWGKDALVNGRGEVFRPEAGGWPADLPRFTGADDQAPAVVDFYRVAEARLGVIGLTVTELERRGRHDWRLALSNGMELLLQQADAVAMLDSFVAALPAIRDPDGRQPVQVDMRYDNGFAVRWGAPPEGEQKSQQRGDA